MIFVITGTEAFPFNRLIIEIDRLKKKNQIHDDVQIQLGSCTYKPEYCTWTNWLPFDIMCEKIREASIVIAHAGAGTTLLCLELGKTPVIVTRLKSYSEHLDDHQIPFAKMMEQLNYAIVAYDVSEIGDCMEKLANRNNDNQYKKNNVMLVNYLDEWVKS